MGRRWRRWLVAAGSLYAVTWLVNRSLVDVRGGSMAPTLAAGDRVVTLPVPGRRLRAGQVVVVTDPADPGHLVVKRISRVDRRFVEVLGDDPAASTDSRTWGPLPIASVRRVVVGRWPNVRPPVTARSTEQAREIFTALPARYDLLADVLSFGQNARWRRAMVDRALRDRPATVADVASGTAGVAVQLARRSDARIVGVDISREMLAVGRRRVRQAGLDDRVTLMLGRGEALPFEDGSFDALTFTYLLRYVPDPAAALRELARVVRPGGTVASLEFHVPPAIGWRWAWRAYTRLVLPVAGGLLGGRSWARVGSFLGPNIDDHYRRYPLDWHRDAWRNAGLVDVEARVMSLGGGLVMSGRRDG